MKERKKKKTFTKPTIQSLEYDNVGTTTSNYEYYKYKYK